MAKQTSSNLEDMTALLNQLQNFQASSQAEWNQVLNQWGNLEAVWRDQQFDRFEPLFDDLKATYREVADDCDRYNTFMNEQIAVLQDKQARLGNLPGS
jgi:hypothetical protein